MPVSLSPAELKARVGQEIATSDWVAVTQYMINEFAHVSGDDQWIHVDVERARRESPFKDAEGNRTTIAHGFLTLSLLSRMKMNAVKFTGISAGINMGFDKVRFIAPVPAGSRIRAHFKLTQVGDVEGGLRMVWETTVEREADGRPALIAEWVSRVLY
jgi:acyl dehydratase